MLTSLIVAVVIAASPVAAKPVAQGRGSKAMVVGKGGHLKAVHAGHRSRRH